MKHIRIALIWKIIIACVLGIVFGHVLPDFLVRVFVTFNALFSQFINFLVPLIILGLVTPAIFRLGNKAGKLLLGTVILAYVSTIVSGTFSYLISSNLFPDIFASTSSTAIKQTDIAAEPYFTLTIPALLDVMTALVTAFIFGIFLTISNGKTLEKLFKELEDIVMMTISRILIPLLPLFIFGIFLKMTYTGEVGPIMKVFAYAIGIIFALCFTYILFIFSIAGIIARKNPFKPLVYMLTAYVTALGTSSSAATIPVTLAQTLKCGIRKDIAGFTIPLCATIHIPGSTIQIVACAVTIMIIQGYPIDFYHMIGFIMLLGVTMVAAPGVPGGAIMASLGLLASSLGFNENDQALMIALFMVMDSFGTACNVTCDGALSMMINHFSKTDISTKIEP